MSRSSPGTWGGEGHSGKREEHVPKIVLSTLQVVHRGGRIGETAGEMGKDVRGLEHHAKQLADSEGSAEASSISAVLACAHSNWGFRQTKVPALVDCMV